MKMPTVSHFWHNKWPKLGLQQHPFVISQLRKSEACVQCGSLVFSTWVSRSQNQGVSGNVFLSGSSGGESAPGSFRLLTKFRSLRWEVWGPRFLAGYQLEPLSAPQGYTNFLPGCPLRTWTGDEVSNHLTFGISDIPFCCLSSYASWRKASAHMLI